MPDELSAEGGERLAVVGHRVVLVVPAQDAGEPASLLGDGLMHASPYLEPVGPQLGTHPFGVGDPLQLEPPLPGLRAHVREAEKLERLRLTETPRLPIPGGVAPELDQPRFLGVQLLVELCESFAQVSPEPLRVIPVLETHHEVVGETHDHDITVRVPPPPLVRPEVEDVVQVDVRKQR